jgi:hypothetical protein
MSRSYRRPFAAITGLASAKSDKQMAHRGVRRKQNLALKTCADFQSFLPPHFLECSWNNTYCWGRDGAQSSVSSWYELDDEYGRLYYRKLLRK